MMATVRKMGKDFTHSRRYKKYLEEAGFVDVREEHFQWPLNPWPRSEHFKKVGALVREDLLRGMEGMTMAVLTRGAGMAIEEVKSWVERMRENFADGRIHAYMPVYVGLLCCFPSPVPFLPTSSFVPPFPFFNNPPSQKGFFSQFSLFLLLRYLS